MWPRTRNTRWALVVYWISYIAPGLDLRGFTHILPRHWGPKPSHSNWWYLSPSLCTSNVCLFTTLFEIQATYWLIPSSTISSSSSTLFHLCHHLSADNPLTIFTLPMFPKWRCVWCCFGACDDLKSSLIWLWSCPSLQAQRYEAASTAYGPHTLQAYIMNLERLTTDLIKVCASDK